MTSSFVCSCGNRNSNRDKVAALDVSIVLESSLASPTPDARMTKMKNLRASDDLDARYRTATRMTIKHKQVG
jgi:hypothetical protein